MTLQERFAKALRKKADKGFRGYPVATVAYYGPDDRRASKVTVGIIMAEGGNAEFLECWYSETGDVRLDPFIDEQILKFIRAHNGTTVAMAAHIIGCPHEEGIDYPEGQKCLKCPFWATRDRWTGEIVH